MNPSRLLVRPSVVNKQSISVDSVARFSARIVKLGGTICKPKTPVPGMGYFAICQDTENNTFAIWERSAAAK